MDNLAKACTWYPVCPMKRFYEERKLEARQVEGYCHGNWGACVRYQMEERGEVHPDNMLPDSTIDEHLT